MNTGVFGENFPYTNFHDLNLDWIIAKMKETNTKVNELSDKIDNIPVLTNNFILPTTDDDTDRSTDIMNYLQNFGYCFLGYGKFVIKHTISMPNGTSLLGMGSGTVLQLADDSTDTTAISVGNYSMVTNMEIVGNSTNLPYETYTRGTRKAIEIIGDFVASGTGTYAHNFAKLSNLTIKDFNHSGIYGHMNNGAGSFLANNIDIMRCHTGINLDFYSEYHSFSNIRCRWCNIAVVMQSGNNLFTNCHFDTNITGIKIDNSTDTLVNPDHSSFSNCTINHSGNNEGYAIWADFSLYGICFSNCQIWYGQIYLNRCSGFKFSNNIIAETSITVTGCNSCSFVNNMIRDEEPTISITNCLNMIWEDNVDSHGYLIFNDVDRSSNRNLNASTYKNANYPSLNFQALGYCNASGKWKVVVNLPGVFTTSNFNFEITRIVLLGKGTVTTANLASVTNHVEATYMRIENITYSGTAGELCIIDIQGNLTVTNS